MRNSLEIQCRYEQFRDQGIQVGDVRSPLSDHRPGSSGDSKGATVAKLRAVRAVLLFWVNSKPTQERATMATGAEVEFNRLRSSVTYVRFPHGYWKIFVM